LDLFSRAGKGEKRKLMKISTIKYVKNLFKKKPKNANGKYKSGEGIEKFYI